MHKYDCGLHSFLPRFQGKEIFLRICFCGTHGENGKDAGRAVGEIFMKTVAKKTKAKTYV
jgi:hypothetical protein